MWQAEFVKAKLEALRPGLAITLNVIKTKGDKILDVPLSRVGGKGLFVKEIEEALLAGEADLAVHSIKDVPMVLPEGLLLACIPKRASCFDMYLSHTYPSLADLPTGALVGTSSLRRQSQLLSQRSDLRVVSVRGNVDTRLRKLAQGEFDALILAEAGCRRLGLTAPYTEVLSEELMLPAVGQGALGIECRGANYPLLCLLAELEDSETRVCVTCERSFLRTLDGGCQVPIGCHATLLDADTILCTGMVGEVDGSRVLTVSQEGDADAATELGENVARTLLEHGGRAILEKLYAVR